MGKTCVQKERRFIGGRLSGLVCPVSDPEPDQSRLSHHVGVLVLQLVQLFALLPQKQDSADGRTSERVKKKEEMTAFWQISERIRCLPHLCSRSVA